MADNNIQQVDSDDGLLFFHTHSLYEVLNAVEKFYECKIYGVLDLQEVEEHLKLYDEKYSNVSKQMIVEGIQYAYDTLDGAYEYEEHLYKVQEYIDTHKALAEDDAYE